MGLENSIKYILLISVIYLLVFQTNNNLYASKQVSLWIHLKSCIDNKDRAYYDTITIYKNGLIFKKIPPTAATSLLLKQLDLGEYKLQYNSLFENNIIEKIIIDSQKEYSVTLCYDYLNPKNGNTIELLDFIQDGEKLSISIERRGCFTSKDDSFVILKNNDVYSITWRNYTKILNDSELDLFKCFEVELQKIINRDCTTVDTYIIKFGDYGIGFIDGSCKWYGYNKLLSSIFIQHLKDTKDKKLF